MLEVVAITLSSIALLVSIITAWLSLLRRGRLRMTQPTVVYFGPDGSKHGLIEAQPKAFIRTLLFSTGKRGVVVESLHLALSRGEAQRNFNIWVYGDKELVRGSGLFVGETGVATNHHFLPGKDGQEFRFIEGIYSVELVAKILGRRRPKSMWRETFRIDAESAAAVATGKTGLYFDWGPAVQGYTSHLEQGPSDFGAKLIEQLSPMLAEKENLSERSGELLPDDKDTHSST